MPRKGIYTGILLLNLSIVLDAILIRYNRLYGDIIYTIGIILFIVYSVRSIWRSVPSLFVIGSTVGFIMEYIGINLGFPFGSYEYLKFKGFNLYGVPIPIVISWGIYIIIAYLAASYYTRRFRWLYASILLVVLDMAIDPTMVSLDVWRWNINTYVKWFGIPYTNFIGWFIVSVISISAYECLNRFSEPLESHPIYITPYILSFLPISVIAPECAYLPVLSSAVIAYLTLSISYLFNKL